MLDIKLIREDPAAVERALATRGAAVSLAPVLAVDAERRRLVTEAEELKAERNRASEAIGQAKRRGEDAQAAMARMREVSDRIKALDAAVKEADARLEALLLEIPNLPHASVPVGALGRRQRRGAPLGHAAAVRVRAEAALRARRGARPPRLRSREQDRQGALHGDVGRGGPAQPRARAAHARSAHARARLHRGVGAASGERGDHDRGGDAAQVRGADVQDGRAGRGPHALPDPDRGGRAHRAARRRDPARGRAAPALLRLHALLPPRGRHLRAGHQGHDPAAPVRQGRDGQAGRARRSPTTSSRRWSGARRRCSSGSSCRTG